MKTSQEHFNQGNKKLFNKDFELQIEITTICLTTQFH